MRQHARVGRDAGPPREPEVQAVVDDAAEAMDLPPNCRSPFPIAVRACRVLRRSMIFVDSICPIVNSNRARRANAYTVPQPGRGCGNLISPPRKLSEPQDGGSRAGQAPLRGRPARSGSDRVASCRARRDVSRFRSAAAAARGQRRGLVRGRPVARFARARRGRAAVVPERSAPRSPSPPRPAARASGMGRRDPDPERDRPVDDWTALRSRHPRPGSAARDGGLGERRLAGSGGQAAARDRVTAHRGRVVERRGKHRSSSGQRTDRIDRRRRAGRTEKPSRRRSCARCSTAALAENAPQPSRRARSPAATPDASGRSAQRGCGSRLRGPYRPVDRWEAIERCRLRLYGGRRDRVSRALAGAKVRCFANSFYSGLGDHGRRGGCRAKTVPAHASTKYLPGPAFSRPAIAIPTATSLPPLRRCWRSSSSGGKSRRSTGASPFASECRSGSGGRSPIFSVRQPARRSFGGPARAALASSPPPGREASSPCGPRAPRRFACRSGRAPGSPAGPGRRRIRPIGRARIRFHAACLAGARQPRHAFRSERAQRSRAASSSRPNSTPGLLERARDLIARLVARRGHQIQSRRPALCRSNGRRANGGSWCRGRSRTTSRCASAAKGSRQSRSSRPRPHSQPRRLHPV